MRMTLCHVAAMLIAFTATEARAQDTVQVHPGARVRVRQAASEPWQTGRLGRVTSDSLQLVRCARCAPVSYRVGSLAGLDASIARRPRRSVVLGTALAGAIAGVVIGYAHAQASTRHCTDGPCLAPAIEPPLLGLAGLFTGVVVGANLRYDQWRPAVVVSPLRQ